MVLKRRSRAVFVSGPASLCGRGVALLRSFILVAAFIAPCSLVAAAEKPFFEESFSGKLSAGWTWIDEVPDTWRLADDSLEMKVVPVPVGEGMWADGRRHPNLLVRDLNRTDGFAVEVQLTSSPSGEWEHAGLLLYADGDNYVVINKAMMDKPAIVMVAEKAAKPEASKKPYEHEEVWLRLVVAGRKVAGQYRHYDSDEWQTIAERELPTPGPYKVGMFAGRPPKDADHRVRFKQFRILPASTPIAKDTASAAPAAISTVDEKRPVRTDIPLAVQARQAATRAIPYIEKDGAAWITDRKCLACHYVSYMVWSLHDARQREFDIDRDKLADWTDWSLNHAVGQGAEGPAQMLLARDRSDTRDSTAKLIDSLRDAIVKGQDPAGFWKPGGQLPSQKRPVSETTQVSTMWILLALDTLGERDEIATQSRAKALAWLKKTPPNGNDPAVSSEWYVARLLVEKRFGDPQQVDALRDKILAAQQPDGGWGWRWADKSDAFGTGVSLYGLSQVGVPHSHPAIQRAWRFLIETQTENGSWVVNGTKTATKDKPHPFSSFWGSTWALLGLSHSLPQPGATAAVDSAVKP